MTKNKNAWLFAYSPWDIIPVLAGIAHLAYLGAALLRLPACPLVGLHHHGTRLVRLDLLEHQRHLPQFPPQPLLQIPPPQQSFLHPRSITIGFSQTSTIVHRRHHHGQFRPARRAGEDIDWLSIYRHGHDGEAESIWYPTSSSAYFRDDPKEIFRRDQKAQPVRTPTGASSKSPAWVLLCIAGFSLNWKFMLLFLPLLLLRPLPLFSERLLPPLRRQSRTCRSPGA